MVFKTVYKLEDGKPELAEKSIITVKADPTNRRTSGIIPEFVNSAPNKP